MPDEDTFETVEERVERFEAVERDTLYALTDPDGQPLWSIADLNREMDRTDVIDYVNGLHRAGLVKNVRRLRVRYAASVPAGADRRPGPLVK